MLGINEIAGVLFVGGKRLQLTRIAQAQECMQEVVSRLEELKTAMHASFPDLQQLQTAVRRASEKEPTVAPTRPKGRDYVNLVKAGRQRLIDVIAHLVFFDSSSEGAAGSDSIARVLAVHVMVAGCDRWPGR